MRFYFSRHLYDICVEHINMFIVDSACELYVAYKHAHCAESLWYVELKCGIYTCILYSYNIEFRGYFYYYLE